MLTLAVILVCHWLTHLTHVTHAGHSLRTDVTAHQTLSSWNEAAAICKATGTRLFEPVTDVLLAVAHEATRDQPHKGMAYWVGVIESPTTHKHVRPSRCSTPLTNRPFRNMPPDPTGKCVYVRNGTVGTAPCYIKLGFLCAHADGACPMSYRSGITLQSVVHDHTEHKRAHLSYSQDECKDSCLVDTFVEEGVEYECWHWLNTRDTCWNYFFSNPYIAMYDQNYLTAAEAKTTFGIKNCFFITPVASMNAETSPAEMLTCSNLNIVKDEPCECPSIDNHKSTECPTCPLYPPCVCTTQSTSTETSTELTCPPCPTPPTTSCTAASVDCSQCTTVTPPCPTCPTPETQSTCPDDFIDCDTCMTPDIDDSTDVTCPPCVVTDPKCDGCATDCRDCVPDCSNCPGGSDYTDTRDKSDTDAGSVRGDGDGRTTDAEGGGDGSGYGCVENGGNNAGIDSVGGGNEVGIFVKDDVNKLTPSPGTISEHDALCDLCRMFSTCENDDTWNCEDCLENVLKHRDTFDAIANSADHPDCALFPTASECACEEKSRTNLTVEEQDTFISGLLAHAHMVVATKNTSTSIRRYTSATDTRPSAMNIGCVGVGVLVGLCVGLVCVDSTHLRQHGCMVVHNARCVIRGRRHNIRRPGHERN